MINKITEANYTWLDFVPVEYTSTYNDTYPTAFSAGIEFIFND